MMIRYTESRHQAHRTSQLISTPSFTSSNKSPYIYQKYCLKINRKSFLVLTII